MPSVLVFGATGPIGQFLLPQLLAQGNHVIALSRQLPTPATGAHIEWRHGDLFAEIPPLPEAEMIYSLGPLDAFAAWFARTAPVGVQRVIALSSMSAESKQDSLDPTERELAAKLQYAEAQLLHAAQSRSVDCTIFRATLIYGTGRDRSLAPIARFARRWRVLPIPYGAAGLRQPVHAADLANACVLARNVAATHGQTYALGGGERLRFDAMLRRIAVGPPRLAWVLPVPLALVRAGVRLARPQNAGALARLMLPLIADNAAAVRDFGYAPRAFCVEQVFGENPDAAA